MMNNHGKSISKRIAERLREAMKDADLNQSELSRSAHIDKGSISHYLSGNYSPSTEKIYILATVLKVNPVWLMGADVSKYSLPSNCLPATEVPMIPEVGEIAAGVPILAEQNIIGYLPAEGLKNPDEYFYLRIRGDSMINAGIPDGSSVLIHKQDCAEDGKIVACLVNGDSATLKRFKQVKDTVLLMPENAKYAPIIVKCNDFDSGYARILGVAVRCLTIKEL